MADRGAAFDYLLGTTDAEHARLTRQAALLAPCSETLFRRAGIGAGMRVLDIGSGMGDVAMLAARLVGAGGEVDRNAVTLARAKARARAAGLNNVRFLAADVGNVPVSAPFDAVVGRLILLFLPQRVAVLRSLVERLLPGGVMVFQEPAWQYTLTHTAELPLRRACVSVMLDVLQRAGTRTEMGTELPEVFQAAGLATPELHMEMPVGFGQAFARWLPELFATLHFRCVELGVDMAALGDLDTLTERLDAELARSGSFAACAGFIGAWSRVSGSAR